MRIYIDGARLPQPPTPSHQSALTFEALPYWTEPHGPSDSSLAQEMLTRAHDFPEVDEFEIVVAGIGHPKPDRPFGTEANALMIDRAHNRLLADWNITYPNPDDLPLPDAGQLTSWMDEDYILVITRDDHYIYLAQGAGSPPQYHAYAKVPLDRYQSEWQAVLAAARH